MQTLLKFDIAKSFNSVDLEITPKVHLFDISNLLSPRIIPSFFRFALD